MSPARAAASRRNGAKSRGPKTPEGKARSAQNALKHGLRARKYLLLPQEDPAELAAFTRALMAELAPEDAVQQTLAQRVASAAWRLMRADRMETEVLAFRSYDAADVGLTVIRDNHSSRALETVIRYRNAAMAELTRALRALQALQAGRGADAKDADAVRAAARAARRAGPGVPTENTGRPAPDQAAGSPPRLSARVPNEPSEDADRRAPQQAPSRALAHATRAPREPAAPGAVRSASTEPKHAAVYPLPEPSAAHTLHEAPAPWVPERQGAAPGEGAHECCAPRPNEPDASSNGRGTGGRTDDPVGAA